MLPVLVPLLLFLLLVFLLGGPRGGQLPPLPDHQLPVMLVARVVPRGLPGGKVEIVNITFGVLAGDEQRSEVSPCSGPKLLREGRKHHGEAAAVELGGQGQSRGRGARKDTKRKAPFS